MNLKGVVKELVERSKPKRVVHFCLKPEDVVIKPGVVNVLFTCQGVSQNTNGVLPR